MLERRAGIEPANTGFADLRVSRFATGACKTTKQTESFPGPLEMIEVVTNRARLRLILPDAVIHAIRPGVNSTGQIPHLGETRLS